jgi:hypothetical protein
MPDKMPPSSYSTCAFLVLFEVLDLDLPEAVVVTERAPIRERFAWTRSREGTAGIEKDMGNCRSRATRRIVEEGDESCRLGVLPSPLVSSFDECKAIKSGAILP